MNPLAIALQGIGFGAAMVAIQGFFSDENSVIQPVTSAFSGGGGPGSQIGLREFLASKKKRKPTRDNDTATSIIKARQRHEDDLLMMGIL